MNSKADMHSADLRKRRPIYDWTARLFFIFAGYTAVPVIEAPIIGISLSAPIFYFLFVDIFFRSRSSHHAVFRGWKAMLFWVWLGIMASALFHAVSSGGEYLSGSSVRVLANYSYWIIVAWLSGFIIVSRPGVGRTTASVLAAMIFLLALMRWYEGFFFGKWGNWSGTRIMTENNYAWLFSCFGAVFFGLLMDPGTRKKAWLFAGLAAVWGAVFINGSRSSWITTCAGFAVFMMIYIRALGHKSRPLVKAVFLCLTALFLAGIAYWASPASIKESFLKRFSSFEHLDTDKSYQIRQLMIQKGVLIFQESPFFGCGPGAFRKTNVQLEIPSVLRYAGDEYFNRKSSHNSYVQFLAENGLSGSMPLAFFLLVLLWKGFFSAVELTREGETWAAGLYANFVMTCIHMWSIASLSNTTAWLNFGLVAGIIAIARQKKIQRFIERRQAQRGSPP